MLHGMQAGAPVEGREASAIKPSIATEAQAIRPDGGGEDVQDAEEKPGPAGAEVVGEFGREPEVAPPVDDSEATPDTTEIANDAVDMIVEQPAAEAFVVIADTTASFRRVEAIGLTIGDDFVSQQPAMVVAETASWTEAEMDWTEGVDPSENIGDDEPVTSTSASGRNAAAELLVAAIAGGQSQGVDMPSAGARAAERKAEPAMIRDTAIVSTLSLPRHALLRTPVDVEKNQAFAILPAKLEGGDPSVQADAELLSVAAKPSAAAAPLMDLAAMQGPGRREAQIDLTQQVSRQAALPDLAVEASTGTLLAKSASAVDKGGFAGAPPNLAEFVSKVQDDIGIGLSAGAQVGWHSLPFATGFAAGHTHSHGLPMQAGAITRQLAEAVVHMRDDRVEIALSPEELGTVRMTLTRNESGGALTVWVERPEVLEMLRRNADLMLADLKESGLEGLQLDFRDSAERGRDEKAHGESDDGDDGMSLVTGRRGTATGGPAQEIVTPKRSGGPDGWRLDIRV